VSISVYNDVGKVIQHNEENQARASKMVSLFFRIVSILLLLFSATAALELPTYQGLRTSQKPGILEVTFHNAKSTTNLWNKDTLSDLTDLVQRLQSDNETKAVVFRSDVPKYFLNHLDLQDSGK